MAIKVTRLQDVFKSQLKESFDKPTIWVDQNGIEHEDTERVSLDIDDISPYAAYIKQIGSHVKVVYDISALSYDEEAMKMIDLNQLFKYAYNLQYISHCFGLVHELTEIPEDLFWNCPNLISVDNCFARSGLKEIPARLFEKSTKLRDATAAFCHCNNLTKIPENLFANCPDLSDVTEVFYLSFRINDIPENLFSNNQNLYQIKRAFAHTKQVDSETNPDISVCLSDKMYQDLLKTPAGQNNPSKAELASTLFEAE